MKTHLIAIGCLLALGLIADPARAAPACYGIPLVSGGSSGCEPTIGADNLSSVDVRMADGETFSVHQGGELALYLEHWNASSSRATFGGDVYARSYVSSSPVFIDGTLDLTEDMNTVVVDPQGDTVVLRLLPALYYAGRRVTVKVLGSGFVELHGTKNEYTGLIDNIDTEPALWIEGTQSGLSHAVTVEAWANNFTLQSGWVAVASYP